MGKRRPQVVFVYAGAPRSKFRGRVASRSVYRLRARRRERSEGLRTPINDVRPAARPLGTIEGLVLDAIATPSLERVGGVHCANFCVGPIRPCNSPVSPSSAKARIVCHHLWHRQRASALAGPSGSRLTCPNQLWAMSHARFQGEMPPPTLCDSTTCARYAGGRPTPPPESTASARQRRLRLRPVIVAGAIAYKPPKRRQHMPRLRNPEASPSCRTASPPTPTGFSAAALKPPFQFALRPWGKRCHCHREVRLGTEPPRLSALHKKHYPTMSVFRRGRGADRAGGAPAAPFAAGGGSLSASGEEANNGGAKGGSPQPLAPKQLWTHATCKCSTTLLNFKRRHPSSGAAKSKVKHTKGRANSEADGTPDCGAHRRSRDSF